MRTIIGIDPGISNGGICVYHNANITCYRIPRSFKDLVEKLQELKAMTDPIIFIEKVQAYSSDTDVPGKRWGIQKMTEGYKSLLNAIELVGIESQEVHPQTWQKIVAPKRIKGEVKSDRKKRYVEYVREKLGDKVKVFAWNADAIMICEYGIRIQQSKR